MYDAWKRPISRRFTKASTQYLEASSSPVSSFPFSMACWFYTTEATSAKCLMSLAQDVIASNNYTHGLHLGYSPNFTIVSALSNGSSGGNFVAADTTAAYPVNKWAHATGVWSATDSRAAYLNGGSKGTAAFGVAAFTPAYARVGIRGATGTCHEGCIVWPCIWNTALSDSDALALARGAHPLTIHPESIVAFWDWSGAGLEFNAGPNQGAYALTNSGSVPVTLPINLKTKIARPWLMFDSLPTVAPKAFHHRQLMAAH